MTTNDTTNKNLITPTEVSNKLRVPRSTVYSWLNRGVLPCVDVYGRRMIDPAVLPGFIQKLDSKEYAVSFFRGDAEISFSDFIKSGLPKRVDSRNAVLAALRAETRPIPQPDCEDDLIAFVAAHPEVSVPPYGAISCLYADWREYQQAALRGGVE